MKNSPIQIHSILSLIGNTPLIDISELSSNPQVKIFAKFEALNPSGSYKDRIALSMIKKAEEEGKLHKGMAIIEPTSGNTGIALAMISAIKGYKFIAVMSRSMSKERRKMIEAFGGKLILIEGSESEAIKLAVRLAKEKNYFILNQFENPVNIKTSYNILANEILSQINSIDVFIAGIGTGGTIVGMSKKLKKINSKTKIIGFYSKNEKVQGTLNIQKFKPKILDLKNVDKVISVNEKKAIKKMKALWKKGFFVGISSGAALDIALVEAKKIKKGKIVLMFQDSGNRYLNI
jgi:cysteine synthase